VSNEDERLALSALQHLLFCPRQCALIHVERLWEENVYTAEGRILHDRSDQSETVVEYGMKVARAMRIWSERLGLYGVCDVVEFRDGLPTPVEFKRGKPKTHRADEVQLCAQAICLEDMFGVRIPQADLFYGKTRRRKCVLLDDALRSLTAETARRCHELIASGVTPAPVYEYRKCSSCSLLGLCLPKQSGRAMVFEHLLTASLNSASGTEGES
jgi:CRISPR-associated exonuclease Cas4